MLSTSPLCLQYEPVRAAALITQRQQQHELVVADRTPSSRSNSNCTQAIRDRDKKLPAWLLFPARSNKLELNTEKLLSSSSHGWAEKTQRLSSCFQARERSTSTSMTTSTHEMIDRFERPCRLRTRAPSELSPEMGPA
ncbi:hypothetical protein Trisim1_003153 [Trichoderma cf. simile WF8]